MIEYQCPDGLAGTVKHDDAVNQRFGLIGSGLGRLCKSVTGSFYSPRAREFEIKWPIGAPPVSSPSDDHCLTADRGQPAFLWGSP